MPYLACIAGSALLLAAIFVFFITETLSVLAVVTLAISVLAYSLSWLAHVYESRTKLTRLVRDTRLSREDITGQGERLEQLIKDRIKRESRDMKTVKDGISQLLAQQKRLFEDSEKMETSFRATLESHHKRNLEEYKTQAFNSYLGLQELKTLIFDEQHNDG